MHDGCKLQSFNGKSDFTFCVNHFTAISYFSHVNWWNFFINRLEAFSFRSQYGISNSRNGFFTVNILVEQQTINKRWNNKRCSNISNDTFYKSLRISSFAVFASIALILMSKFDAIFLDLCKFPEMLFCLHLFEM